MKSVIPPTTQLPNARTQQGFTMIELVIVVTMVAVLAALAAPSMQKYVQNNRIQSTAQELYFSLQTARSEATKRQANVVVCAQKSTASSTACATSEIDGWMVFVDADKDFAYDSGETILESHTYDTSKLKVFADAMAISYVSTGFANSNTINTSQLLICDSRGVVDSNGGTSQTNSVARGISISATGRAQTVKTLSTLSGWASGNSWTC